MPGTILKAFTPNGPRWMEVRHREVKRQVQSHKAESPYWDVDSGLEDSHLYCELPRLRGRRRPSLVCLSLSQAPGESTRSVGEAMGAAWTALMT